MPLAQLAPRTTRAVAVPAWPVLRFGRSEFAQLLVPLAGAHAPPARPLAQLARCGTIECAAYPGMAVWLLLACLLPLLLRDRRARFWLAVAAAGLLGASGVLGLAVEVPGLRGPARLLLWWSVAVSVLGGLALAAWPADASRAPIRTWWTVAAALAAILVGYVVWQPWERRPSLGAALALALAAAVGFTWRSPRRLRALAVAALAVDVVAFRLTLSDVGVPPEVLAIERSTLLPVARVLAAIPGAELDRALYLPSTLARNHAIGAGVRSVQGYNPLVLRSVAELLGMPIGLDAGGYVSDRSLTAPWSHALDLLRVRVLTLPTKGGGADWLAGAPPGRFERLERDEAAGLVHYQNTRAAPVAWLVPRLRRVAPGQAIPIVRDDRSSGGFDPAREALVEEEALAEPGDAACWRGADPAAPKAAVLDYEDDRILLATGAPCRGVLVTSELAYPGWRATVDGSPAALGVVNGAFRGLVVPAGGHRVELRYTPTLPWIARLVALTAAVLLLATGLGWCRDLAKVARRRRTNQGRFTSASRAAGTGPPLRRRSSFR
jgi:hypothetical protein